MQRPAALKTRMASGKTLLFFGRLSLLIALKPCFTMAQFLYIGHEACIRIPPESFTTDLSLLTLDICFNHLIDMLQGPAHGIECLDVGALCIDVKGG